MGAFTITKEVPGTPEALFNTIIRPATWEHWFSVHRDFLGQPPEELALGSRLTSEVLLLGMTDEVEWTVLDFDAPNLIVLRGRGYAGLHCEFSYGFRASGSDTIVNATGLFTGPDTKRTVAEALRAHARDQLDRTLGQLAELAAAQYN